MQDSHKKEPDEHFLEQVGGLRENLASRQRRYQLRRYLIIAGLLLPTLIIGTLLGFKEQSHLPDTPQNSEKDGPLPLTNALNSHLAVNDKNTLRDEKKSSLPQPSNPNKQSAPFQKSAEDKDAGFQSDQLPTNDTPEPPPVEDGDSPTLETPLLTAVIEKEPTTMTTSVSESAKPVAKVDRDYYIRKIVVCRRVIKRQWSDEEQLFSIKQGDKPHVWMDVRSKSQPFIMKHVYYKDNIKFFEVPLDILYPRMRTWSYITLLPNRSAGSWKVEILADDGMLMEQIQFEVVP
jgi:hypothetical protein